MSTVVITGSSSGIGQAVAVHLATLGYHVAIQGCRNISGLQQTASLIEKQIANCVRCFTCDVSDPMSCHRFVQSTFAWRGRVDHWINIAGADVISHSNSQSFEQRLQTLIDVDVMGTIRLSRLVADCMLSQELSSTVPSIINTGWDQALLGMEGDSGQMFCTSKGAIMAFTQALALSVAPRIRVNCIAPGWIKTHWGENRASNYWNQRACNESQSQRWGTSEDIATTISWLISDQSSFINGQTISINGGRRFYPQS